MYPFRHNKTNDDDVRTFKYETFILDVNKWKQVKVFSGYLIWSESQ